MDTWAELKIRKQDGSRMTQREAALLDGSLQIFGALVENPTPPGNAYTVNEDGSCNARMMQHSDIAERLVRRVAAEKGFEVVSVDIKS